MKTQSLIRVIVAAVLLCSTPAVVCTADKPVQSQVCVENATVTAVRGGVDIRIAGDKACQITFYAITGQPVKQLTVNPGVTHVDLAAGFYIVRIGSETRRIIVP